MFLTSAMLAARVCSGYTMHNSVHFFVQHALWEREKEESSHRQFCISTFVFEQTS